MASAGDSLGVSVPCEADGVKTSSVFVGENDSSTRELGSNGLKGDIIGTDESGEVMSGDKSGEITGGE